MTKADSNFLWRTGRLDLHFVINEDDVICLRHVLPTGTEPRQIATQYYKDHDLPLVSIKLVGQGNTVVKTGKAMIGTYTSAGLKYIEHEIGNDLVMDTIDIRSRNTTSGIEVATRLSVYRGTQVIRATTTVTNCSHTNDVVVTELATISFGGLSTGSERWYEEYSLMTASNGWFREAQWRDHSLPDIGIDSNSIHQLAQGHTGSQAVFNLSNRGSFSTGSHLAMGVLTSKRGDDTWIWQIEHNGSWKWEIGDFKDSIYLSAGGPNQKDHAWKQLLRPGECFTTVPVAVSHIEGTVESAVAALTDYRRLARRPHVDMDNMPIIFNDYMNCLMGDPDEDKIAALLGPVRRSGAEYFVIDAGWYADDSNWWDDVGLWEPSKKRFPSGFDVLLNKIKSSGLVPGLWLEPEVVGVKSVVGDRLPEEAFFQEGGQRVVERGRFQLDYRCDVVRTWMDSIIHNLVVNYGAGYFKFDYNIEVITGTERDGIAPGAAHLEHQRAYLAWVKSLLDRYPGLVIENCSSGAQRMDYAMLGVHPLQSTSDQQDPVLYAAIAAALPTAVTPEQSATWTYPQPEWSDEMNALTTVNSLLGRIHLSGRLDILSAKQFRLIADGMDVYKTIRQDLRYAHAVWPLGFPKWHDDWVCLCMLTKEEVMYMSIWRRSGPLEIQLPLKIFKGAESLEIELLYPATFEARTHWDVNAGLMRIKLPDTICARFFRISSKAKLLNGN